MTERYGQTKITTIRSRWATLRDACRSEGTPEVQDAFDQMESFAPILHDQRNLNLLDARDEAIADQEAIKALQVEVQRLRRLLTAGAVVCEECGEPAYDIGPDDWAYCSTHLKETTP